MDSLDQVKLKPISNVSKLLVIVVKSKNLNEDLQEFNAKNFAKSLVGI